MVKSKKTKSKKIRFKKIKQFTPIWIIWRDATSEDRGWIHYDDVDEELLTVISCGLFFSQNEESITLVQSTFRDIEYPNVSGNMTIPKSIIIKYGIKKGFK